MPAIVVSARAPRRFVNRTVRMISLHDRKKYEGRRLGDDAKVEES